MKNLLKYSFISKPVGDLIIWAKKYRLKNSLWDWKTYDKFEKKTVYLFILVFIVFLVLRALKLEEQYNGQYRFFFVIISYSLIGKMLGRSHKSRQELLEKNKIITEQKSIVEEKNREITESIE